MSAGIVSRPLRSIEPRGFLSRPVDDASIKAPKMSSAIMPRTSVLAICELLRIGLTKTLAAGIPGHSISHRCGRNALPDIV